MWGGTHSYVHDALYSFLSRGKDEKYERMGGRTERLRAFNNRATLRLRDGHIFVHVRAAAE